MNYKVSYLPVDIEADALLFARYVCVCGVVVVAGAFKPRDTAKRN